MKYSSIMAKLNSSNQLIELYLEEKNLIHIKKLIDHLKHNGYFLISTIKIEKDTK